MELTPHDQEQYDALTTSMSTVLKSMTDPHLAPNTRMQLTDELNGILAKRQAIIYRNKPKDERSPEDREVDNLFKSIETIENDIYGMIEQEEVIKRALGSTGDRPMNYKMKVRFGDITRAIRRIASIQNGEINLEQERQEQIDRMKKDEEEQTAAFMKKVDDEKARKHAFSKSNWRAKSTFDKTYNKPQSTDPFARFYLNKLDFKLGQEVKALSNKEGVKMLWDPYIQRWYITDKKEGDPKFNEVRNHLLPADKNKIAKEWSSTIKDELNTKGPEDRPLTNKIHKTSEPEFWKKEMKSRGL